MLAIATVGVFSLYSSYAGIHKYNQHLIGKSTEAPKGQRLQFAGYEESNIAVLGIVLFTVAVWAIQEGAYAVANYDYAAAANQYAAVNQANAQFNAEHSVVPMVMVGQGATNKDQQYFINKDMRYAKITDKDVLLEQLK
jgi:hypothetical protein